MQVTGSLVPGNLHSFQLLPVAPNTLEIIKVFPLGCVAEVFLEVQIKKTKEITNTLQPQPQNPSVELS